MVKMKGAKDKNKHFRRQQMEVEKVAKMQRKQATEKQKQAADSAKAFLVLFNRASNAITATVTTIATSSAEARTTNPTTPSTAATSTVPTLTMTATATSSEGALNRRNYSNVHATAGRHKNVLATIGCDAKVAFEAIDTGIMATR